MAIILRYTMVYPIFYEPTVPSVPLSEHVKVINWISLAAFFWWQRPYQGSAIEWIFRNPSRAASEAILQTNILYILCPQRSGMMELSMKNRWDMLIQPSIVGIFSFNQWIGGKLGKRWFTDKFRGASSSAWIRFAPVSLGASRRLCVSPCFTNSSRP